MSETRTDALENTGPVGRGDHVVRQGECISSIAGDHGLFWKTIWDHPKNAELKQARKNPDELLPGDCIFVPDLRPKQQDAATEQTHKFRRLGVPVFLRIRLLSELDADELEEDSGDELDPDLIDIEVEDSEPPPAAALEEPLANAPFTLIVDGVRIKDGTTDSDGVVKSTLPPNARTAKLIVYPGTKEQWTMLIQLGHLDPETEWTGIKQRLGNLGYECDETSSEASEEARHALSEFQEASGLAVTGVADQQTLNALKRVHDG